MKYLFYVYACLCFFITACQVERSVDTTLDEKPKDKPTTFMSFPSGKIKEVIYDEKNGWAVVEWDIIVADLQTAKTSTAAKRPAIRVSGESRLWDTKVVPYTLSSDFVKKERVNAAIEHFEKNTKLKFVERTNEKDYIAFVRVTDGCSSFVGKAGGKQPINISDLCSTGNTIHEIAHAMGLWHEQSREDRDKFIKVRWENILDSEKHNFNQHITDGDDVGEYDYQSVMHYGSKAFSKNGLPTITFLDDSFDGIGANRQGLSEGDKAALAKMYP